MVPARADDDLVEAVLAGYHAHRDLLLDATGTVTLAAAEAGLACTALVCGDQAVCLREQLTHSDCEVETVRVRGVEPEDLPAAVAAYTGEVGLLVVTDVVCALSGWWNACREAVKPGGCLVVVCGGSDSGEHIGLVTLATGAGLAYTQHLVVASSKDLDAAVAAAEAAGSVWATGQHGPRYQRRGYLRSSTAHPAKMLPAIARHAIGAYTRPGDTVMDPMCGIGTTLVEAIRAGRHAIGVEYEPRWTAVAAANLHHARSTRPEAASVSSTLLTGDARDLTSLLPHELHAGVDLVVTSPPYGASLHGQVTANPGEGVTKTGDTYHPDRASKDDHGNLADQSLPNLQAGMTSVFAGCRVLLRPGGIVAVTARPFRHQGVLVDFPGMVVTAALAAGLAVHERCAALMAAWRDGALVARPSFFQLDYARKQARAGRPVAVIVHEDVLVFTNPSTPADPSRSGKAA